MKDLRGSKIRPFQSRLASIQFGVIAITVSSFSVRCSNDSPKSDHQAPRPEGARDTSSAGGAGTAAKGTPPGSGGIDMESIVPSGANLLDATFELKAKAAGIELCDGTINIRINAAFGKTKNASIFELPTSEIDCALIGKLNLKPIVGLYSDSSALPEPILADNVLFFDRIATTTFKPPRPFLPSFLAASREELKNLNVTRTVTVKDEKRKQSASGTMTLKMLAFGANYQSPIVGRSFPDTFTFEVKNTGFEGIDKTSNVLFDRIAMTMSLNPIAILELGFSGDAASLKQSAVNNPDLIPGPFGQLITVLPDSNSQGIGGLIGSIVDGLAKVIKVDLELRLKEQKGLGKEAETSGNSSDDGIKVGN